MTDTKKSPGTIGEWDIEIATKTTEQLQGYSEALRTLREWDSFNEAFKWTRIFVLEQSIQQELKRRAK